MQAGVAELRVCSPHLREVDRHAGDEPGGDLVVMSSPRIRPPSMRRSAPPDPHEQKDSHHSQTEAEAPPDALETEVEAKREPPPERQRKQVVTEEVGDRGGDRGAHAAKDAASYDLRSIEELKCRRHGKNRRAQ